MEIQLIRNATVVVQAGGKRILVDPCLSAKGGLPPFTLFRRPPRMNPVTELPENAADAMAGPGAALVTHRHPDHLDRAGIRFLRAKKIPVFCPEADAPALAKMGLKAVPVFPGWDIDCLGGALRAVPAMHGSGLVGRLMGAGAGFLLRSPGEPSLYIAGDTVLTEDVRRVLREERPDVCVVNAGGAVLDLGKPILMPLDEVVEFVRLAPGKVVAVHMEALNHCVTTREMLRSALASAGLADKALIPADGETVALEGRP